jgi:hypothetical protein
MTALPMAAAGRFSPFGPRASTKLQAREVFLCLLSKRFEIGDHIVNDMV